MGRKCRHDLRIKRQWSEWKTRFEPTTSTTPPSTTPDIDATNCATETSPKKDVQEALILTTPDAVHVVYWFLFNAWHLFRIYIEVPRPLTNDLWVFLFQTIDAEYVKWASPSRPYVCVKAFIVKVKKIPKTFFLVQHINIVNRVTLKSFWLICSCLSYTQRKDSSNNHLHTLSTKLIMSDFDPWRIKR